MLEHTVNQLRSERINAVTLANTSGLLYDSYMVDHQISYKFYEVRYDRYLNL